MQTFKSMLGEANLLFVTLDTLRFDAAQQAWRDGRLKTLGPHLGESGWELRHTPGSFTYAAHHAFFSGFLPTPADNQSHARLFAAEFAGSTSIDQSTWVFQQATLPEAMRAQGYLTLCVGGTGFFNQKNAIGSVLPDLFEHRLWTEDLGVTCPESAENQCQAAGDWISEYADQPLFVFINASAIHQPNWFYAENQSTDNLVSHTAALVAFDKAVGNVLNSLAKTERPCFCLFCSDHGTAYGEDGYHGHRLGHSIVWQVPYTEFWL